MNDAALFQAIREIAGRGLTQGEVDRINQLLHPSSAGVSMSTSLFTVNAALELIGHEAIVQELYKDSVGVWTWGIGVTEASGQKIMQYKDAPQPLGICIRAFAELVRAKYLPEVVAAFNGRTLKENEVAAALSFHYNTGAIGRTDWVKMFLAGNTREARTFLETHYLNDGQLKSRRMLEAALFFDGKWSSDGKATVYPVKKPQYTPDWNNATRIYIRDIVQDALR